jgi:threonine synthase
MVVTKVYCSHCGNSRENFETLCNKCNFPFILKVAGPYEKRIEQNFDYIQKPIFPMNHPTPIIENNQFKAKLEFYNPTLSYKDRGMNTLFSFLKNSGRLDEHHKVCEDSSGNAGASFSLFSKVLNLDGHVFMSHSANPIKMAQIESYGSEIHKIEGTRKDVELAAINSGMNYLGHQYWPEFYDGFRAISYEIFEQFDHMPENIIIPFSTGTLYLGIFEGLSHLLQNGLINKIPTLWAIQPEIASGMYDFLNHINKTQRQSVADALTGVLPLRHEVISSIIGSYGRCETISESEIINSKEDLLNFGLDCEYSSAISYGALKKFHLEGRSLLILSGHGIKNLKI